MPARNDLGHKDCLECGNLIIHKIKRDIERKKFCSKTCLGMFTVKHKLSKDHMSKMQILGCSPEANAKKAHKGEAHPRYIKDRSQVKSKRSRYENTVWTKSIFERDNFTCQDCGQRGGKLQADHIKPYCICSEDEKWNLENGRTLCVPCHKKTDTYGIKMVHKLRKEKEQ
jgi:hypothetical protein